MKPSAETLLADGEPRAALQALQSEVRERPAEAKLRVFLFQLLCVLGDWVRAGKQLEVCGELDPKSLAMVAVYREAIAAESVRASVMAGTSRPVVHGPTEDWIASLVDALASDNGGDHAGAARLRTQAFDAAPATRGTLNGEAFEWIADADTRLGPMLEVVVAGSYRWLPFSVLSKVVVEAPVDLRDLVWAPAHLTFATGDEQPALIPVRYALTEAEDHGALLLARKTDWIESGPDQYRGLGQRLFVTDVAEVGLLEMRELLISPAVAD